MGDCHFTVFETAIGACALAWRADRIAGVQLPERDPAATRARLLRRLPAACEAAPAGTAARAVAGIVALLEGVPDDLSDIVLDDAALPAFARAVYAAARRIGPGATATYGEIADRIGAAGNARAVGRALGLNPFAVIVPCHRVIAAGGRIGGFSAGGGAATKGWMLAIEGGRVSAAPDLFSVARGADLARNGAAAARPAA